MYLFEHPYLEPLPGKDVLPYLLLGTEWYADRISRNIAQQRNSLMSKLRIMTLNETCRGHHFYAGSYYFALGTLFFDACDYRRTLGSYRRSFECWSTDLQLMPRRYARRVHVWQTRIVGWENYDAAEVWRQGAIIVARDRVQQFGP
jgi:hypothetical protein